MSEAKLTEKFFNEHFVTVEQFLVSLDTVTAQLKSETDDTNIELVQVRQNNLVSRRNVVDQLNDNLEKWAKDGQLFDKTEGMKEEFDTLLTQLKQQYPIESPIISEFEFKFEEILRLAESRKCLVIAKEVRDTAQTISSLMPKQFDKALGILNDLLPRENELHQLKLSENAANKNVALKTLHYFRTNIRQVLQSHLDSEFKTLFAEAKWPSSTMSPKYYEKFIELFTKYLDTESTTKLPSKYPIPLESFKALLAPIDMRFRFHFEATSVTNRPDKPEWPLHHFINIVDSHLEFLTGPVSTSLKQSARFSDRNAVYEFIVAFLPSVRRKMFTLFPEVSETPQLLSHLVYETVMFDNALKDKYYFLPYGRQTWRGISGDLLSHEDWFKKWLSIETESAMERYQEIQDSPNAFEIDYDAVDPSETKPTISAVNLKDLIETITDHYSSLTSVKFRLRYFLAVQVNLLDKYYGRLVESIDAFDSMTSTFSRAVGGVSAENMKLVTGLNGLERLCRIFGSLNYTSYCLEQWGDEEFFLELWEDITKLTASKQKLDKNSQEAIATVTKPAKSSYLSEGTLFDETNNGYKSLLSRVEQTMVSLLMRELQHCMREYFKKNDWAEPIERNDAEPLGMSRQLVQPIKTINSLLSFLHRFFSPHDYIRVVRHFAKGLEKYYWNYIISANQFSYSGGIQLQTDIGELWAAFRLPSEISFRRLDQISTVLALPVSNKDSPDDVTISDLSTAQNSTRKFTALKTQLLLSDITDNEIQGLIHRRVDKI